MLRTLINRTMTPGFNSIGLTSRLSTGCLPSGELTKKLLTSSIEWKSLPCSSPLGNILCYWNQFAILLDEDPLVKNKFIINCSGEEMTRLEILPTNWQLPDRIIKELPHLKPLGSGLKVR